MDNQEVTELVDVSEVSEALPADEASVKEGDALPALESRSTIATLKERFAAFFIDMLFFFYFYFLIGLVCRRAFYGSWSGPVPSYGWQGLAFNGIFVFFCFMYYFVFESVFFATPGKFICWTYVRRKNGALPSMASVFVRNVLRFLDYMLPVLPFCLMELTRRHQRLGDLAAGTTVIKKHGSGDVIYNVSMANIASASGRIASFLIDLLIVGLMTFGFLLILSPDYPGLSMWLLLFSPLVPFLYFVITEPIAHTSPGKWVFGYTICHEDGAPVSFSGSLVRTLLRLFDTNIVGLLTVWLSAKRQRFGDLAADTVITAQKRRWQGGVALGVWFVVALFVFWFGIGNQTSLLKGNFRFNFIPALEVMGVVADEGAYKELTVTHIRFAANDPNKVRTPAIFEPGETLFIVSDVYGYERSGRLVWIQEDLEVKYPDGSIGLHQENIVDYHQVITGHGPVELTNSVKLPDNAQGGEYVVTLTVRDLFAHEQKFVKETFSVKAAEAPKPMPVPQLQAPSQFEAPSLNAPPPGTPMPPSTPPVPSGPGTPNI